MKRWFAVTLTTAFVMVLAVCSVPQVQETIFNLTPQLKFLSRFAQPGRTPTAQVIAFAWGKPIAVANSPRQGE